MVKDTSDTNAAVLDTIPKDTSKVDTIYNLNLVSDTVMDGRYRTIYLVPDNRIYGTQMFSFTPTEFWTSPPKGVSGFGGSAFEILGTTVILRENNKQLDSINIVVSSDSLINDTIITAKGFIGANDSVITIISIANHFDSTNLYIADTLKSAQFTSRAGFYCSTKNDYIPTISRLNDDFEKNQTKYFYTIFTKFNYKMRIELGFTDALWNIQ